MPQGRGGDTRSLLTLVFPGEAQHHVQLDAAPGGEAWRGTSIESESLKLSQWSEANLHLAITTPFHQAQALPREERGVKVTSQE